MLRRLLFSADIGPESVEELAEVRAAAAHRLNGDLDADIAIHLNLGIVYLYQQDAGKALDHLRLAGARASAIGDAGARAHAWELTGVAAWLQGNRGEAVGWWQRAERLYARVDESEGRARCLQHLGAAELTGGHALSALRLLEDSARLRGGTQGHEVLADYLDQIHAQLGRSTEPIVGHAARWWNPDVSKSPCAGGVPSR